MVMIISEVNHIHMKIDTEIKLIVIKLTFFAEPSSLFKWALTLESVANLSTKSLRHTRIRDTKRIWNFAKLARKSINAVTNKPRLISVLCACATILAHNIQAEGF